MQKRTKAQKHSNVERLIVADITLAELSAATVASEPILAKLEPFETAHLMGNSIQLQVSAAYMHDTSIALFVSALVISFPIIYKIESGLYDRLYKPAGKKLASMLRVHGKNSESFK
ncbi:MAG: hypothetical protein M1544_03045 [Candidatus Marsarchaeota archaeon]|nr:hypothetical protein [Candidatus Marsarchaeota archaeon]MCL5102305.1 hypothetical protein [Candidatus Marsarchaeota archaeon]